jgi:hypothetical protein
MGYFCIALFLFVLLLAVIAIINGHSEYKVFSKAKKDYDDALARLQSEPTIPQLRQDALRLGRAYSQLTRNKKGITVFDELAVKNDIDAACAGAVSMQSRSIEGRLQRLKQLLDSGHLSPDEYRRRRQNLIDEV